MATIDALLTAEQFAQLPDDGVPRELDQGEIVEMNVPGFRHGQICAAIARILGNHAYERRCGHVISNDSGVITQRNPDSVRGPDVSYYSYARLPADQCPVRYAAVPPELVFEVLSPDDRWPNVLKKVAEYLTVGVQAVCVVDPQAENLTVYTADAPPRVLSSADTLELSAIVPDWRANVADLLALPGEKAP